MVKRLHSDADLHPINQSDEPDMKRSKKDEPRTDADTTDTGTLKGPNMKIERDRSEDLEGLAPCQQIDRKEQARKQFAPLSKDWKEKLQNACKDPNFKITTPYLTIRNNDVKALLDIVGINGIETADVPERLVEAYVRMICDYKNSLSDEPRCAMLSSDMMDLYNPQNKKAPEDIKERISEELEKQKSKGTDLLKLDYLFIPYHRRGCHWYLLGVAPKQKFFFLIDSVEHVSERDAFPIRDLLGLVLEQLPQIEDENWPLFTGWATKGGSGDDSPKSARQGDLYNCGMFCVTNAMCLAFGYPLRCYQQRDLDGGKRERVVAELMNGGFEGFGYEIFEIPGEWKRGFWEETEKAANSLIDDADREIRTRKQFSIEERIELAPKKQPEKRPAQFHLEDFQRNGLLYAIRKPLFNKTYGKTALEQECKSHNIKSWIPWSQSSEVLFRKWMENYVAGEQLGKSSFIVV